MAVWAGKDVAGFCGAVKKINQNGVDLVPVAVFRIVAHPIVIVGDDRGMLIDGEICPSADSKEEIIPVEWYGKKVYILEAEGIYEVRLPKVEIPKTATGFCYPRSSFARLGVIKSQTAVFDSGYVGEGSQTFHFPAKAIIGVDEAWVQMVFVDNKTEAEKLYDGKYQGEKVKSITSEQVRRLARDARQRKD